MFGGSFLSQNEILFCAVCSVQTLSDFVSALFQDGHNRRPNIFHAEPNEESEGDALSNYGGVEIHESSPSVLVNNCPAIAGLISRFP
jgi:hypothetical protein